MRSPKHPWLIAVVLLPFVTGCTESELSKSWQIDRLRILAVRAEPAEPAPGDLVTFQSLTVHPEIEQPVTLWFACLLEDSNSYGCDYGSSGDSGDTGASSNGEGFIGYEPDWPPSYTPEESALEGLTEAERVEGRNIMLTLIAFEDADGLDEFDDSFDDSKAEFAYKRVTVSENPDPNQNPSFASMQVEGVDLPEGGLLEVDANTTYTFTPILDEDSVQPYTYTTSDGVEEQRTEEPYFTIFVEAGTPGQPFSLYPYSDLTWRAPSADTVDEFRIWTIVRDRRGGMAWWTQRVIVR